MDEFTQSYVKTAVWTAWEVRKELGRPVDQDRLAPQTLDVMKRDAKRFQREQGALLERAYAVPGYDPETAGHDFWLTRNGDGAGFWDGDLPDDIGNALSDAAHKYGEQSLYLGDDGKIYAYGREEWANEQGVEHVASEVARSEIAQDFPTPEDAMHHAAHVGFTHFTQRGGSIILYGPGPDGMSARARLFHAKGKYHISKPGLTKKPIPSRAHVIEHEAHHEHEHGGHPPSGSRPTHHAHAGDPEQTISDYTLTQQRFREYVKRAGLGSYVENSAIPQAGGVWLFYAKPEGSASALQFKVSNDTLMRVSRSVNEAGAPLGAPSPDHQVLVEHEHRGVVYRVYQEKNETTCAVVIAGGDAVGHQGWHLEGFGSPDEAETAARSAIDSNPSHYGASEGTWGPRARMVASPGHAPSYLREKGLVWLHRPDGIYWANATGGTYWIVPTPSGDYHVSWSGTDGSREDLGMHALGSAYQVAGRHTPGHGRQQVAAPASGRFEQARKTLAALGITLKHPPGGYDGYYVNFRNGKEETAYYTDDLDDALTTGRDMARRAGYTVNATRIGP